MKLKKIFSESLGLNESKINDTLAYQKESKWDSISHMVLVSNIESRFKISLDTDEVVDLSTFGKAKKILRKHKIDFSNVAKK